MVTRWNERERKANRRMERERQEWMVDISNGNGTKIRNGIEVIEESENCSRKLRAERRERKIASI